MQRSLIRDNSTLRYWPWSAANCITPRSSPNAGVGAVMVSLRASAPLNASSFTCWFGDTAVNATVDSGNNTLACTVPPLAPGTITNLTALLPYLNTTLVTLRNCTATLRANGTIIATESVPFGGASHLNCSGQLQPCSVHTQCDSAGIVRVWSPEADLCRNANVTCILFRLSVPDIDTGAPRFFPQTPTAFTYFPGDQPELDPNAGERCAACAVCGRPSLHYLAIGKPHVDIMCDDCAAFVPGLCTKVRAATRGAQGPSVTRTVLAGLHGCMVWSSHD